MYFPTEINVEEICYKPEHIEQVLTAIKLNFYEYFHKFLETESGSVLGRDEFARLAEHFGSKAPSGNPTKNLANNFKSILAGSLESFQKDRDKYLQILDAESFVEYRDDPSYFKNTILKNQCPIIRTTLQNKRAKELDKFRKAFNIASPNHLLNVVQKIATFANSYINTYDEASYDRMTRLEEMGLVELNKDEYFAFGVIGGGIRSEMLFKMYPCAFPSRSREAVWALWYLTEKKAYGCEQDSEFLMINKKESTTQQNYFYPYDLFVFYAFQIYRLICKEAERLNVHLAKEYRYVIVDAYLSYVAKCHEDEINLLRMQLKEDFYD